MLSDKITDWKIYLGLFACAMLFLNLASAHIDPQATFDAAYYHIMVNQLEKGKGLTEPFIWQFLNERQTVEHPIDYWMPLGIYFYYAGRKLMGIGGEIFSSILLWSLLCVLVYSKVYRLTNSISSGIFSFCWMIFCGRNLFYLLTTDNIALYGFIGFFFFNALSKDDFLLQSSLLSAMGALTRIEGTLIILFNFWATWAKTKKLKYLLASALITMIAVMPWVIRNQIVLGKPWTSNFKALLIVNYSDIFRSDFHGTIINFINQGFKQVVSSRLSGLFSASLNLIAVPTLLWLYPLSFYGIKLTWEKEGKYFVSLLGLFIAFCSLAIPLQAEKGTAMHISALFLPHFAVFGGLGFFEYMKSNKKTAAVKRAIFSALILWMIASTLYIVIKLESGYLEESRPYSKISPTLVKEAGSSRIVSNYPIRVFLETGISGVVMSPLSGIGAEKLAEKYDCNFILQDNRTLNYQPCEIPGFNLLATNTNLLLWKKAAKSTE